MLLTCNRCLNESECNIKSESPSGFVCPECRCIDCQIVLCVECGCCGEIHGTPSKADPRVCEHCVEMRSEIDALDPEFKAIRAAAIAGEDPLYI